MKTYKEFISEGTWSIPDTPAKKKELKKLLSKPLSPKDALDKLYHLTGDDDLFDFFDSIKDEKNIWGVNDVVRDWLKERNIRL